MDSDRESYEEGYDKGYEDGYENGMESARDTAYEAGYEDAIEQRRDVAPGDTNLCLKCDCRKYGFDCILSNPRAYMENKILRRDEKPPRKKVTNPDYDRAMEIFGPK